MKIKSIKQVKNLKGKKVFLRCDFNVPLEKGKIKDNFKIIASLPTIRFLSRYKCKIIIATHLEQNQKSKISAKGGSASGGKKQKYFSIKPIAKHLEKLLGRKITFIDDCIGLKVEGAASEIKEGDILMLENLRFYKGEKDNDKKFAQALAGLADIYVNDAFAVSHRSHASVSAIKEHLPAYAGLLIEEEILNLNKILKPQKPLVAVIGGAKIRTKLPFIGNLLKSAKYILTGGAMANNFLATAGFKIGKSLTDKEEIGLAKKLLSGNKKKIILPVDVAVSDASAGSALKARIKDANKVGRNDIILDIGPSTIKFFAKLIKEARTVVWNGPMGKFEAEHFRHGTLAVARVIASRSRGAAFGVVGGGETIEALKMTKMAEHVDWISTGGGAMLAYLGGEKLPGLEGIIK